MDFETLNELYIVQQNSIVDIAKKLNINRKTVSSYLHKYGIEIRNPKEFSEIRSKKIFGEFPYSKEELYELYIVQNMSCQQIADQISFDRKTVSNKLKSFGITKSEEQIKLSTKETINKKYGGATAAQRSFGKNSQTDSAKEKRKQTNLAKYGCENVFANIKIKEKIRQYYNNNPDRIIVASNKRKLFYLKRFGVESNKELLLTDSARQILGSKDSLEDFIKKEDDRTVKSLCKKIQCSESCLFKRIKLYGLFHLIERSRSYFEMEIRDYIMNICDNVICGDRTILNHKEIDILCPDNHIGIECDGTYWHADSVLSITRKNPKYYHENKSLLAQEKGIRLIHIYEYEWNDPVKREIIKSLLRIAFNKVENRIYARNCEIREITNKEAKPFNDANHLQGHRNAQVTYGLFYNNELVQLMSFSKHKKYEWEIIRGCPGSNNLVVGGVSKLFTHFLREYNPSQVFSYCDFNKFDGVGYEKLGMKFIGYTGPDMKWIINGRIVNRNPKKHEKYAEIADDKIFGAGSKKYLWERQ